ncbi:hypothetical protein [Pararobbsia silviterrae]|uniref:hypothetical protein n=1 Tax=Pararobbsia silviterrae TaxID=1792498 RepID=UPI001314CC2D|nr:hypothetical protein [Pararobbsia silviterrae]
MSEIEHGVSGNDKKKGQAGIRKTLKSGLAMLPDAVMRAKSLKREWISHRVRTTSRSTQAHCDGSRSPHPQASGNALSW